MDFPNNRIKRVASVKNPRTVCLSFLQTKTNPFNLMESCQKNKRCPSRLDRSGQLHTPHPSNYASTVSRLQSDSKDVTQILL